MAFITYVKTATLLVTAISELIRAIHNASSNGKDVMINVSGIDPHKEAIDPNEKTN